MHNNQPNKKAQTTRNDSLDVITGIMILWMICYHAFIWAKLTHDATYKIGLHLFYYFMPWFYFKSGMFFRPLCESNQSLIEYTIKCSKSLLMPLATWWLAGYLVIIPELIFLNNEPLWKIITTPVYTFLMSGDTLGNGPLWFFISLFVVKVSGYYISRYKHFYFSSIFIILVGFVLSKYKIILPLSLSTVPIGLLFYFAGYLYSKQSVIFKNKYLIILLILMLVICNYYYSSYVDVHLNKVKYGNYFIFSFASLLTIPVLIYLSEMISSKILSFIGNKSFYFFVLHWPVFYLVKAIYSRILSINMADVHGYIYLLLLISVALSVCLATIKMFGSNQLLFGK